MSDYDTKPNGTPVVERQLSVISDTLEEPISAENTKRTASNKTSIDSNDGILNLISNDSDYAADESSTENMDKLDLTKTLKASMDLASNDDEDIFRFQKHSLNETDSYRFSLKSKSSVVDEPLGKTYSQFKKSSSTSESDEIIRRLKALNDAASNEHELRIRDSLTENIVVLRKNSDNYKRNSVSYKRKVSKEPRDLATIHEIHEQHQITKHTIGTQTGTTNVDEGLLNRMFKIIDYAYTKLRDMLFTK